ncbi:MAG: hypothetical protein PHV30_06405 [Candidatus Margulisbacteria bacterium]|nr:hypothetical protein [Candidatus Margulisiibacteriota bacterium]
MRGLKKFVLASVLMVVLAAPSFSLLQVQGVYTGFAKGTGVGLGLDFPLIPFFPTSLLISQLGDTDINVSSGFSYGGQTWSAGTFKFSSLPIELQVKFPFGLMGVNWGVNVMADLLTGKVAGNNVSFPGGVYGGVFGEYKQDILPLISGFAQLGYLIKLVDAQKAIDDQVGAGKIDLSGVDRSGLFYRFGVSIGF